MTPLTHFSLFTGIGGLDLAAAWAGFRTVGQVERDLYPSRILRQRFGPMSRWRGVRDVTEDSLRLTGVARPTVLSGGFPCQPFSCAGKRRGRTDDRYLWPEMLRVVRELRPAWVVGENVAGIINMALDDVCADLESLGYSCRAFVVPAAGVGAPHMRDRVFIVAHSGSDASRQATTPPCSIREDPESRSDALCSSLRQPPGGANTDLADTNLLHGAQCRQAGRVGGIAEPSPWDGRLQWATEPRVGRVADGVPSRVDRLRCLGNAVVPQQAYPIFAAIAAIETGAIM